MALELNWPARPGQLEIAAQEPQALLYLHSSLDDGSFSSAKLELAR